MPGKKKGQTEAQYQASLKQKRYDESLIGGLANKAAPYISGLLNKFSDYRQSNLDRTDETLKSYGYDLDTPKPSAGGPGDQKNEIIIPEAKQATFPEITSVEAVGETSEQNPLKITAETNVSNGGKEFVFGKGRSSGMNLSIDNSISSLGKNLQQNMDLDSKFDKTNSNVSSKTRGGLFGNYGKKVEIRKTFDESTGRTNKQKFIDGELSRDRNARQDVRRKGKSSDARAKRKAGRNK